MLYLAVRKVTSRPQKVKVLVLFRLLDFKIFSSSFQNFHLQQFVPELPFRVLSYFSSYPYGLMSRSFYLSCLITFVIFDEAQEILNSVSLRSVYALQDLILKHCQSVRLCGQDANFLRQNCIHFNVPLKSRFCFFNNLCQLSRY